MKIYTKTGDKGTTALIGGTRISKSDKRLEAYGTVDELNSFVGLLLTYEVPDNSRQMLYFIQNKLFVIGSFLATDAEKSAINSASEISNSDVKLLEDEIDNMNLTLPELRNFILPGGNRTSAVAHVCRTISRRAERNIQLVIGYYKSAEQLCEFMNRLSDFFFVLARYVNLTFNTEEIYWKK